MTRSFITLCLLGALIAPTLCFAQNNPRFQNPALDSNCYFPQFGNPEQLDSIHAWVGDQQLGAPYITNLGPRANGDYGNILISNLTPASHVGASTLSQVKTGKSFDLHHMQEYLQHDIDPVYGLGNSKVIPSFKLCHLRDRSHVDIFDGRIFWADDDGNYDSSRFTRLRINIPVGDGGQGVNRGFPIENWYVTHLTSDTIDDIVISAYSDFKDFSRDTAYVLLYRGGQQIYLKDTISEDTSAFLRTDGGRHHAICTQADFRGTGRDDLILTTNADNMFFFRNDPPFSLAKLAHAIINDTLFSQWQNPGIRNFPNQSWLTMPALPHPKGSSIADLVTVFYDNIYIFGGGPDFGSKRIYADSASYVIHNPGRLGLGLNLDWPNNVQDAGDMTGTGNHVLFTYGSYGSIYSVINAFYVMGEALDEKIDMFNRTDARGGDTLTANNDSLEDFLVQGPEDQGTLVLYYGAKDIPVRLNPQFSSVAESINHSEASISLYPNPITAGKSVATINWPDEGETVRFTISNLLGTTVQSGTLLLLGGLEQYRFSFSNIPSGVYILELHGVSHTARLRVSVMR